MGSTGGPGVKEYSVSLTRNKVEGVARECKLVCNLVQGCNQAREIPRRKRGWKGKRLKVKKINEIASKSHVKDDRCCGHVSVSGQELCRFVVHVHILMW